jgi:hypothetical protein
MKNETLLNKIEDEIKGQSYCISNTKNESCGSVEGIFKMSSADIIKNISEENVLRFHFINNKGEKVTHWVCSGYSFENDIEAVFRTSFMSKSWSNQTYFRKVS